LEHPAEETLIRFGHLKATRAENREVVCHLLRGCTDCAAAVSAVIWPAPGDSKAYEEAITRVFDKLLYPRRGSWASFLPFKKPELVDL
jgi:hypothetical protein